MDSPPSTTMLCPVQKRFSTVRKYAQSAISSGDAQRLRGVSSMICAQSASSSITGRLSGVSTPPGSRLLQIAPHLATRRATFLV